MLRHSRDLDLTEDRFLTPTWLTPVLPHNTLRLLRMHRPAVLIRPILIDSSKIWPVYLNLNLGLIWVGHVYIKSHILPNLILFHILLVGAFPSLLNLMVTILVQLGSMLANMSCNWEKRVLMMLCGFAYFLCL
jgi:hypothetical protein